MKFLRTPVIVAVVVALTVGGTATAAKLITGKQIKNGSIGTADLSKKAKKSLKGAKGAKGATGATGAAGPAGAVGPAGPAGAKGDTGAAGAAGAAGLTAPAGWMGKATGLATGSAETEYGYVNSPAGADGDVADRVMFVPNVALRATRLNVLLNAQPGGLASRQFVLRVNGEDTALACNVIATQISCFSNEAVTIPASAQVVLKTVTSTGQVPAAADALYAITLERP